MPLTDWLADLRDARARARAWADQVAAANEERSAAARRLTDGLARLDALNLPPLTEDEVAEEVQAARGSRQAGQGR